MKKSFSEGTTGKNIKQGISFIAQSGGLAGAMGWWTPSQKLPVSKVIHLGKGFHINEADVLEFFLYDDTTKVISLFIRDITDDLINAVKKVSAEKPILFYYVGKEEDQDASPQRVSSKKGCMYQGVHIYP